MPAPQPHSGGDADFIYVIYIRAPQQKVWDALTDGTSVRPWWADTQHDSTFKVGDPIIYRRGNTVHVRGEILEKEAPTASSTPSTSKAPAPSMTKARHLSSMNWRRPAT